MPTSYHAKARALASLATISPEEDAAITAAALTDPNNPPLTDADFARMAPAKPRRTSDPDKSPGEAPV